METQINVESDQPEVVVSNTAPDAAPEVAQDTEPERDRVAERFGQLTGELDGLRSVTSAQQAELARLRQGQGQQPFTPKPEYESHEFKRYLDSQYGAAFQQQQQAIINLANQNELLNTRMAVDDQYGAGTFRKVANEVEAEFQAELAKGTPESREKIFYRVAAKRRMNLVPVDEREEQQTRSARKRSAQAATVGNAAPARRADAPGPEKPISAMTKEERDAAMQAHISRFGGF
jgi:hypothetical protein